MKLERITLRQIRMPLVHFFETSFSRTYSRDIILVEVSGDGVTGWGEVTAGEHPFYNEEWTASAWGILHDYVAPRKSHSERGSEGDRPGGLSYGAHSLPHRYRRHPREAV